MPDEFDYEVYQGTHSCAEIDQAIDNVGALGNDLKNQSEIINSVIGNPILKTGTVTHTTGWTQEPVIEGIDIVSGTEYAVKTTSSTALPACYLYLKDAEGNELANRNLNGKTTDKWTMTLQSDYSGAKLYIGSASNVTVDLSWGYNQDGNAITEINSNITDLNKSDEKLTEGVGVINNILDNPVLLTKTVTHSTGWNPKTIIFDGINLESGTAYAIKTNSAVALPSSYMYLVNSDGSTIANRTLTGKEHDKWTVTAAQDYQNCSIRVDAGSTITIDVSFGYNRDNNAISDLRDASENILTDTCMIDKLNTILETDLYLRKVKYCEVANTVYTVFDGVTMKASTSYTLQVDLEEEAQYGFYVNILNSDGTTFRTFNLRNLDTLTERLSSSVLREGMKIVAQYSGYDGITADITFRETNPHSIIDELKTKNEFNMARAIIPKDDRRAFITIIDDDGKSEFYDVYKSIIEAGYKITCAIDPVNWTGVATGFMDWDQVHELKDLGCEFVVHGAYPWLFPKQDINEGYESANALRAYFRACQDKFKEEGLDGWSIGVYPQSNNNHDTRTVVKEYFKCVFGGTPPTGESVVNVSPITTFRIYRMAGIGHSDGSSEYELQVYKDAIDETLAKRGWLVILNHSQYDFTPERKQKLIDILDYARSVGVTDVSTEKGFEIFRNILEIGDFNNKSDNSGRNANVIGSDGSEYRYPMTLNGKTILFNQDGTITWDTGE